MLLLIRAKGEFVLNVLRGPAAALLLGSFLVTGQALAQCTGQPCRTLQAVFNSAMIDFRGYRTNGSAVPNLSTELAKVACQMNTWANNVPMYVCYAQVPLAAADSWFRAIVDGAKRLQVSWSFKIEVRGDNRYADAGPENCEVTPTEGPYIGQCPFHAQLARQADGSANLYLWINSYSSPYLIHHLPSPPKATRAVSPACDDFCQNFKKAFAARLNAFADLGAAQRGEKVSPEASVTFPGARKCSITRTVRPQPDDPLRSEEGTRFACFWQELSATAAGNRFRDLTARVQALIPTDWSAHQQNESDDATGAAVTAWLAIEPAAKHDVRLYFSGSAVALHITAWTSPAP